MKNLEAYEQDAFEFHKIVIHGKRNSKSDPNYNALVSSLNGKVEQQFKEFDKQFRANKLEDLDSVHFSPKERDALHKLYSYRSKIFQKLKIELTTDSENRIINTCQNCTIGEVGSFDHFIPKDEFAEFVVNPRNLVPSCTKCNGYKNTIWRQNNRRLFLNLYLDRLPKEQYLFVNINSTGNTLDLEYYIENKNNIDPSLFCLIDNHYNRLRLFQRFKENSGLVVSELENLIRANSKHLSIDKIREVVLEYCRENQKLVGHNYWKLILKKQLINNADFIKGV